MIRATKIILVGISSTIVLGGLGYFGFSRSIYNQRTCEWANIDNIELHTGVDIPKIKTCYCEYQKEENIKMAYFDIDKANVDMDHYIKTNNFKKLTSISDISFDYPLKTGTNVQELTNSSDLYYTKGSYNGETWQTLLDISSGRLWVTIKYND